MIRSLVSKNDNILESEGERYTHLYVCILLCLIPEIFNLLWYDWVELGSDPSTCHWFCCLIGFKRYYFLSHICVWLRLMLCFFYDAKMLGEILLLCISRIRFSGLFSFEYQEWRRGNRILHIDLRFVFPIKVSWSSTHFFIIICSFYLSLALVTRLGIRRRAFSWYMLCTAVSPEFCWGG